MIELPDVGTPRPVKAAAALVRDREHDVAAAKSAVEETKAAIADAMRADREDYAAALDAGRPDPGDVHEAEARVALVAAERRLAGEELRLEHARAALDEALNTGIETWQASVEKALVEAERDELDLVDRLQAAELERAHRRQALTWVRAYRQASKLPSLAFVPAAPTPIVINPQAGPHTHDVLALVAGIRAGLERATLQAEAARLAEREHADPPAPALHVA
jgi:hypothetical protein